MDYKSIIAGDDVLKGCYYVSDKDKAIFIRSYKVASTSIGHGQLHDTEFKCIWGGKQAPIEQINFSEEAIKTYFKFMMVRDPYARLVSAFTYLKRIRPKDFEKNHLTGTFDNFIDTYITTPYSANTEWLIAVKRHTWHQNALSKIIGVDYVAHLENIDEWRVVENRLNLPPLTQENKTKHNKWESYYTDDLKEKVYTFYKEDFNTFGYDG